MYEKLEKIKDSIQPEVDVIWSNGPSSEFKNRFMVKLLKVLSAKYSRPFHWKYFATSHGKGVVDGIGGSAKSLVRQRVMSCCDKAIIVQSAQDFANVAKDSYFIYRKQKLLKSQFQCHYGMKKYLR